MTAKKEYKSTHHKIDNLQEKSKKTIGKARATFWDNLPAQNDKSFKSKACLYSGNSFVWLVDVYNKPFLGFKM